MNKIKEMFMSISLDYRNTRHFSEKELLEMMRFIEEKLKSGNASSYLADKWERLSSRLENIDRVKAKTFFFYEYRDKIKELNS